jgi:hypothetical protein
MVLLQGSTLPTLIASLNGDVILPPLSLSSLTFSGLVLYLWRAIDERNMLYIVGNSIGLVLNSIIIGLIIL